jgi:hypothetical protein
VQPPAPSATVDLGPLEETLDEHGQTLNRIAELLGPKPDELPGRAAEPTVAAEVEAAKQETGELRKAVGGLQELVEKLAGERETLRERFEARIEKVKAELGEDASKREIAHAYVRDLAREKLSAGAGFTVGKILAGSLGLSGPLALGLAVLGLLVSRRVKSKLEADEPLLLRRLADRLGRLIERQAERSAPPVPAAPSAPKPPE